MRFDIVFYLLGVVCFILAASMIPFFGVTMLPIAFLIVFFLFGLLFAAFGYSTRPRHYKAVTLPNPPETKIEEKPPQQPKPTEAPMPPQQAPSEPSKPKMELTRIKGIGPKRVAALNALQIISVQDLTKFSAEELAEKLRIPSKITAKWVEQAQNLLKEKP